MDLDLDLDFEISHNLDLQQVFELSMTMAALLLEVITDGRVVDVGRCRCKHM